MYQQHPEDLRHQDTEAHHHAGEASAEEDEDQKTMSTFHATHNQDHRRLQDDEGGHSHTQGLRLGRHPEGAVHPLEVRHDEGGVVQATAPGAAIVAAEAEAGPEVGREAGLDMVAEGDQRRGGHWISTSFRHDTQKFCNFSLVEESWHAVLDKAKAVTTIERWHGHSWEHGCQ